MAYIGKAPNTAIVNQATSQSFSGNGSTTAFTLNRSVNVGEDLEVFVENVQQEPGAGKSYTASGTTLTFDEAPPSGTNNVYVIYRGEATINPRLEHDANAALAATTGTFSGAVSATNGTFSGNLDVDGTTTVDGLTSSEALDVTTSTHANASVFKSTGNTQVMLQDTDATANDQFWGLQVSGGAFNILTCNDDRASGFLTPLTIDSNGRITMPTQPAFRAGLNGGYTHGSGNAVQFNDVGASGEFFNQGNHLATSGNYRFTAPVSGVYFFHAIVLWQGVSSGVGMQDSLRFNVNGSVRSYSERRAFYVSNTTGDSGYYSDFLSDTFRLDANDYVFVQGQKSEVIHGNNQYTRWSGFLIG